MARTSSKYDHFDLYLTPVTLTFNLPEKCFKWHFSSSKATTVQNYFEIRFARVSSHVDDFNTRNKVLTAKLLRQGYGYLKIRKAFSKLYRRHFDIVSKYNVGLKTLLLQGLSEPEFYGNLVYKFRKIIGKNDFPYHFKKIIVRYKKVGYNIDVL